MTVTATDAAGNHSSKTFTVTVKDTTAPVISAPDMTVQATQSSGWKVGTFAATATDSVGVTSLTFSKSVGTVLPFGTTTVTVTAKDAAGNTSTATFTVTVIDTTAPVITAPDVTVEATSSAGAKATFAPTATDAVGPVTITVSIASNTTFAIGTTPVTVTATDGHGNVATATFNVTVRDTTPPTITWVSGNLSAEATGPAGAVVTYAAATATDTVSNPVTISYSQSSGTTFAIGSTTVTVTATDSRGNSSTKSFTVTVKDTTAPVLTVPANVGPVEATGPTGAAVTYGPATATDTVGVTSLTYSKNSGDTFAIGTTTVIVTAKDAAGNTTTKTFTVTVKDTTAPVITAPDMIVQATQSSGWKVGTFAATATDAVGVTSLTFSKSVGTILPFGVTTVTVTAKDAAGNTSTATFTVTVIDTTAPVITSVSANLVIEATSAAGAKVNYAAATATDAVGPVTITYSAASGSTFAIGTTTVTVTATDGHGNVSTSSFTVKVQDTTAPTINLTPYAVGEAVSLAGGPVTYPFTVTDAVGVMSVVYSTPSGSFFPMSFTGPITVTATDFYGNVSTATFTVFVHDSTPPVFTSVSPNLVIEATSAAGAVVNFAPATATDATAPVQITYSKGPGSTFGIGTTTVRVTATDIVGNVTVKTFTITVRDTTPPVITTVSPNLVIEATSPSGASVSYAAATATDAVGPVYISYSKSSGSTFSIGTTTVTVTAKDAYGNVALQRTFTVTVRDTTPPVITAPDLVVEATSPAGAKVTFSLTATDAVGPVTITTSIASNTTFAIGTTTVTVTATDGHGNVAVQTFNVKVQDTTAPVIVSAPNLTLEATSTAGAVATFAASATDAVGTITYTYSIASGSTFAVGTTSVTVTATDSAGNHSSKTFTVKVQDTTPPVISAPANMTIEATSASGAVAGFAATASDLFGPVTISYSKASGSVFTLGTTTVTITAKDFYGNTSTKTFTITVRDTTPPVFTSVSPDVIATTTSSSGTYVSYAAAVATDTVSAVTITYSKASGSKFAVGTTIVTVTAKDAAGNSTTQTFTVTVVKH